MLPRTVSNVTFFNFTNYVLLGLTSKDATAASWAGLINCWHQGSGGVYWIGVCGGAAVTPNFITLLSEVLIDY